MKTRIKSGHEIIIHVSVIQTNTVIELWDAWDQRLIWMEGETGESIITVADLNIPLSK